MSESAGKAVFLSYASQDAEAARRICETLRAAGIEIWFDQSELVGGDAWDAKIRRQVATCALFVPVISANTQARLEGYFRLEWKLAANRTQTMAEERTFILPVVIDETRDAEAKVPAEFRAVQWTKLLGGETTAAFVQRVAGLLGGASETRGHLDQTSPAAAVKPGTASFGDTTQQPKMGRRVPAAAWIGGAAVVAIGIVAVFFAPRKTESAHPTTASHAGAGPRLPTAEKSAAPVSEARELVAKARQLYEPWDFATASDFALAEKLLKRAIDLDPTEAEAWASWAILSCGYVVLFGESSEARRTAMRTQAENAIKLAPDSDRARFARAFSLRFNPQTRDESIRLLREEAGRQPTNRFVLRILGATLRSTGQPEQALVYLDKAAALPGSDPITHLLRGYALSLLKRFPEAEAAYDEALAIAPGYATANAAKLHLVMRVSGDLARAQALLAKVPPEFFTNPRGAEEAYYIALFMRDATKCLKWVQNVDEFLLDRGPKALLTARAQRLAGNGEAARTDLRAALRVVDDRLGAEPNNSVLLFHRADILAKLGDRPASELMVRELGQRLASGDRDLDEGKLAQLQVQLGQREEAIALLAKYFRDLNSTGGDIDWVFTWLRFDPVWDPLRGDPRFEALLKVPASRK